MTVDVSVIAINTNGLNCFIKKYVELKINLTMCSLQELYLNVH